MLCDDDVVYFVFVEKAVNKIKHLTFPGNTQYPTPHASHIWATCNTSPNNLEPPKLARSNEAWYHLAKDQEAENILSLHY